MAAQKGSALLLKATLSGSESTVAGLRSTSMSINGETVDITNKSCTRLAINQENDSDGNRQSEQSEKEEL